MKAVLALVVLGLFVISGIGVIAVTQDTSVIVTADLTLKPTPDPLTFGSLTPGSTSSPQEVTLTPGNSSLSVSVNITGASLLQSIQADFGSGYADLNGKGGILITNNVPLLYNATLAIPPGTKQNTYNGQIVYTVNEAP